HRRDAAIRCDPANAVVGGVEDVNVSGCVHAAAAHRLVELGDAGGSIDVAAVSGAGVGADDAVHSDLADHVVVWIGHVHRPVGARDDGAGGRETRSGADGIDVPRLSRPG